MRAHMVIIRYVEALKLGRRSWRGRKNRKKEIGEVKVGMKEMMRRTMRRVGIARKERTS